MSTSPAIPALAFRDQPSVDAGRLIQNQESFAAALGRASAAASPGERARDAAEQFVMATLILPLLKQLRATNKAAPPFAPTQAERQFGALQDADLAQRIAQATRFPLVDRVARDLLAKASEGRDPEAILREVRGTPVSALPAAGLIPGGNRANAK